MSLYLCECVHACVCMRERDDAQIGPSFCLEWCFSGKKKPSDGVTPKINNFPTSAGSTLVSFLLDIN